MLWVGIGSALGGMVRYGISLAVAKQSDSLFPIATLTVNVTGSFLIGFLLAATAEDGRWACPEVVRNFLMVGILGGYTTFSSFSIQTVQLMEKGAWGMVTANILGSVILCLAGAWAGLRLARALV